MPYFGREETGRHATLLAGVLSHRHSQSERSPCSRGPKRYCRREGRVRSRARLLDHVDDLAILGLDQHDLVAFDEKQVRLDFGHLGRDFGRHGLKLDIARDLIAD